MTRALVTGAGKRLGRAMALELARQGHDVAVHYATSAADAESVAAEIRAMGRQAVTLCADLVDEAQVTPLIARAAESLGGPILTLVNNASIFEYDNITTATRQSWDRHIESNLRAPFVLMQEMSRAVPEPATDANGEPRARGLVVNMIDQRVRKLTPEFMTYTIAKMGLWALTRTGAQALAPRIRVNAIGPGPTLQGHRQSAAHFTGQRRATILGRGSDADEVCATLAYLLKAPGVTGQLLCVDGGQHLGWQTPDVLGVE
ncbi:MAG: short chain dehydrogenase [Alphaproteobacteria bacterium HGW-Alphaproteobacteria-1]|nr:MAG: short chain dehydrogenase [Alphaproteobacteria bacterium HGW-Alphaproteobacteria-1]